ncbi:hypothetical protein JK361_31630 [Streptomyces sp. 5-8]|uniref:Uncharacterized protein n=1 Tax=Streptomyces musisoli TaxID=2802280 RepID=A0ABS1P9M9_9ACTN|nr:MULTISPECIES: hypothetical protein [Streptomyces]MBL1109085.1 hypothetical protein [Streptomyces musisoli]MBY8842628.1 hypothetical protein [Streptomyces sp. SP2-10]
MSVDSAGFSGLDCRREVGKLQGQTGLLVLDPFGEGGGRLVEILREHQHGSAQRLV